MALVSLKELIEQGAHFGHKASKWNPRMKPYIFGKHKGVHIINLKETLKGLVTAIHLLKAVAKSGGEVLFVGTKRQAQPSIASEAKRCGMHYVSERWLGGTLTNFDTIRKQLNKLLDLEKKETDGTLLRYNKKEQSSFQRELKRLRKNLGGIRDMKRLPQLLAAVDYKKSKTAIDEARIMRIPTICLIDTDDNPLNVTVPIPVNDDASKVIQIVLAKLADAVIEGRGKLEVKPLETSQAAKPIKVIKHTISKDKGEKPTSTKVKA